ncbi:ABC transporter ATP-binding protein [Pyxidicoccus fallax]|uniref:ABC transporter ATP-binding protein n=1 Tax=Pyxidicoccus fallax TaxID=394095 RepID=A0A848LCF0_9BACT|nr:ABC transporter ATP-binding protein [Pyxidicoccus fallax]NMO13961.1 ABC transporter ATP-binding protein [Pyxidicoccus fallax]NPC86572.1 ABC transporter ATP-binding protein [Pyxidicoccus fallax]
MDYAIRTEGLTKTYGPRAAVKDLSLEVPVGSVFGFLGPNGAGKTTTIRMLLGLVRPTSGTATVMGVDVSRQRSKLSSLVGAIVEVPAFYMHLSGAENLRAMALSAGRELPRAESDRLLEQVGLSHDGKRAVKQYSLGMKQRLGLAVALMGDPPVLFLDEPTNGLDPDGAREIRELIVSLRQAGRTLFVSSHLLQEVERFCTDVAIVQNGELRIQGPVETLLASRGIELRVSSMDRARAILNLPAAQEAQGAGPGWVLTEGADSAVPATLRKLLQADVDVFEVRPKRSSLEQLFFEATAAAQGGLRQ